MEAVAKRFFLTAKSRKAEILEEMRYREKILEEIEDVRIRIDEVGRRFNLFSDGDLIESVIFEERALRARYAYLLRLAKASGVSNDKVTCV